MEKKICDGFGGLNVLKKVTSDPNSARDTSKVFVMVDVMMY